MKPALSLVFFTVLSGAGLGLAVFTAVMPAFLSEQSFLIAAALSLALVAAGLGASTLHLANPKNAWRAVMRVRTSWLSREAVLAAAFFPLMALYAFFPSDLLRVAVAVIALLTVFCTAMIYQSLKTIPQWHHFNTSFNYLAMALMSGGVVFDLLAKENKVSALSAFACSVLAVGGKVYHYLRIGKCEDISVGKATGFSQAKARLLDAGHTGDTFLTHEFVYHCPADTLLQRRILAVTLMIFTPLMAMALTVLPLVLLVTLAMFGGLLLERWLFFAEARHSVRAYHGVA